MSQRYYFSSVEGTNLPKQTCITLLIISQLHCLQAQLISQPVAVSKLQNIQFSGAITARQTVWTLAVPLLFAVAGTGCYSVEPRRTQFEI